MQEVGGCVSVMYQDIVNGVRVSVEVNSFQQKTVLHNAATLLFSEKHLFAMYQVDSAVGAILAVGYGRVDAIVVNHAVLQYLTH